MKYFMEEIIIRFSNLVRNKNNKIKGTPHEF